MDEAFTGDVPHQVKHNDYNGDIIRSALKDFSEKEICKKFSDSSPSSYDIKQTILSSEEVIKSIVKVADWLSFLKFSSTEEIMGNEDFTKIKEYCIQGLIKQVNSSREVLIKYGESKGIIFVFKCYDDIIKGF